MFLARFFPLILVSSLPTLKCDLLFNETITQQLSDNNFLLGLAQLATATQSSDNQSQCDHELHEFLMEIYKKTPWSLKVIDSFGHAPRSFMWGNYFWFGARELCDDLNKPFSMTLLNPTASMELLNETSAVPFRFTMIYMNFTTPYYINWNLPYENFIHLGLCLPESCDEKTLSYYTQNYFNKEVFAIQNEFQLQLKVVETKVPQIQWSSYFKRTGSIIYM